MPPDLKLRVRETRTTMRGEPVLPGGLYSACLFRPGALLVWGRLNDVSQRGAGMVSRWVLSEVWRGDKTVQGKRDVEKQQQ